MWWHAHRVHFFYKRQVSACTAFNTEFAWHDTLTGHDFATSLGFLFKKYSTVWRKTTNNTYTFYLLHGRTWNFNWVYTNILMTRLKFEVVWIKKVMEHFVTFPTTLPCQEETNMAVASMLTCKIGLIWHHMNTRYNN